MSILDIITRSLPPPRTVQEQILDLMGENEGLRKRNHLQQRIIENSHANNAKLRAEVARLQERRFVWAKRITSACKFAQTMERYAIIRWLRNDDKCKVLPNSFSVEFEDIATLIERGEHLR